MSTEHAEQVDKDERDDEGLLLKYDVIICGTGLVQSIVASALARAGKSVLHCDPADYYGELDAVWTFPYINERYKKKQGSNDGHYATATAPFYVASDEEEGGQVLESSNFSSASDNKKSISLHPDGVDHHLKLHSFARKSNFSIEEGTAVITPYGKANTGRITHSTVSFTLTDWTMADGKHPVLHVGFPSQDTAENTLHLSDYLLSRCNIRPQRFQLAHEILETYNRHLALDMSPALLYCTGPAVAGLLTSSVADYLEFKSIEGLWYLESAAKFQRVPCSKNDVFTSPLLSPMDKRRLMKFLQLALDYAVLLEERRELATIAAEEARKSEPSNNDNLDSTLVQGVQMLNERHLNQGRSLARPQNKAVGTTDMQLLENCIAENMDFNTYLADKQKLPPKLRALVRFALALESSSSGDEATSNCFSLAQGMLRLCQHMQALGRYGTTAFLATLYGSGELPQAFCRSAAVYGATYLLRRAPTAFQFENGKVKGVVLGQSSQEGGKPRKLISCSHVIVPDAYLPDSRPCATVYRRISILCGRPIVSDNNIHDTQQRHVIILPPESVGNTSSIHGLLLDESVRVTPHVTDGCTLLHLTMTMANSSLNEHSELDPYKVMENAVKSVLESASGDTVELCHLAFSYCLFERSKDNQDGLHVISRRAPDLVVDAAFEQAQAIFNQICPTEVFLSMSEQMTETVKERQQGYINDQDDEDELVLRNAMGMIESSGKEQNES